MENTFTLKFEGKLTKADKMLKNIGYERIVIDETDIIYQKTIKKNILSEQIWFMLDLKEWGSNRTLNIEETKAVIEFLRGLEWIE